MVKVDRLVAASFPTFLLIGGGYSLWILYWNYPALARISVPRTTFPMLEMSPVGAGLAAASLGIVGALMQGWVYKGKVERFLTGVALCLWSVLGVITLLTYGFAPPLVQLPDSLVGIVFSAFLVASILPWLSWLVRPDSRRLNPRAFKLRRHRTRGRSRK